MSHWIYEFNFTGKQVKSVDGKMLGNVLEVENNYVLTENESKYFLPAYLIEKYDGNTLWFKIDGDEAKSKFMLGTAPVHGAF